MASRKSKRKKSRGATKPKRGVARKAVRKSARRHSGHSPASSRPSIGALFEDLVAVQSRLRAPGGCPWDREQTHDTLKTYLIEEAYEVLDALENGDSGELAEELGDLLLQVLFHADIALEAGTFDLADVIIGIRDKMIRRHPHVFGNVKAETSDEVLKNWAQLKAQEKQAASVKSPGKTSRPASALDGVPRSLPALLEAYQLTRKAAQFGFDWHTIEGIFEKLHEEVAELRAALDSSDRQSIKEEVGDVLFVGVNLARFLKIDPEVSLKLSNLKFKTRFQWMESQAASEARPLGDFSKEELELLWESAKQELKTRQGLKIYK